VRQRRTTSLVEAVANVLIGVGVACVAQIIIFPWFGIYISLFDTGAIALIMTGISIPRSYLVRRGFEHLRVRGILA
jgi:hypothetical protein